MIIVLPDPTVPDLCIAIESPSAADKVAEARNAAATLRAQCGESELPRLLDWLAGEVEWLRAGAENSIRRK